MNGEDPVIGDENNALLASDSDFESELEPDFEVSSSSDSDDQHLSS